MCCINFETEKKKHNYLIMESKTKVADMQTKKIGNLFLRKINFLKNGRSKSP